MVNEKEAVDALARLKASFATLDDVKRRMIVSKIATQQGKTMTSAETEDAVSRMSAFLDSKYSSMSMAGWEHIDKRPITQLFQAKRVYKLPNGDVQEYLPDEKPLSAFPSKPQWRPQEAALAMRRMAEFYESPYGNLANAETLVRARSDLVDKHDLEAAVLQHTSILRTFWASPETVVLLADDPFVDMMKAAAIAAPDKPLSFEELPSERGIIFFQREQKIPGIEEFYPARAMSWLIHDNMIFIQVLVDGHHEANSRTTNGVEPPRENYSCLYVRSLMQTTPDNPELVGHGSIQLIQFIRSIDAIARSAHTKSDNTPVQVRVKRRKGRQRQLIEGDVRVLSLHNPDYGRYELDAATGRHLRQHWVRGHWRNQWYARECVNRPIWIDGFVRGDAALGHVSGPRVYFARGEVEDGPNT